MSVRIRIPRPILEVIRGDLARPHPYAAERIGFLFARCGHGPEGERLVLGSDYASIPDGQYVRDRTVGARINSEAIRSAMQRVLRTGDGAFHVHMHPHPGRPCFSWIDKVELWNLVPPFKVVGPEAVHGLLLLSKDDALAVAWVPGQQSPVSCRVSIVGYPTLITGGR